MRFLNLGSLAQTAADAHWSGRSVMRNVKSSEGVCIVSIRRRIHAMNGLVSSAQTVADVRLSDRSMMRGLRLEGYVYIKFSFDSVAFCIVPWLYVSFLWQWKGSDTWRVYIWCSAVAPATACGFWLDLSSVEASKHLDRWLGVKKTSKELAWAGGRMPEKTEKQRWFAGERMLEITDKQWEWARGRVLATHCRCCCYCCFKVGSSIQNQVRIVRHPALISTQLISICCESWISATLRKSFKISTFEIISITQAGYNARVFPNFIIRNHIDHTSRLHRLCRLNDSRIR